MDNALDDGILPRMLLADQDLVGFEAATGDPEAIKLGEAKSGKAENDAAIAKTDIAKSGKGAAGKMSLAKSGKAANGKQGLLRAF